MAVLKKTVEQVIFHLPKKTKRLRFIYVILKLQFDQFCDAVTAWIGNFLKMKLLVAYSKAKAKLAGVTNCQRVAAGPRGLALLQCLSAVEEHCFIINIY